MRGSIVCKFIRVLTSCVAAVLAATALTTCELLSSLGGGRTRVTFTLPVSDGETVEPTTLLYIDMSADPPVPHYQPLQAGANSVAVLTDRVYLFGLIHDSSASGAVRGRDVGSAISLIGNIDVVSVGLDSLPVGTDAETDIDLGALVPGEDGYSSGVSADQMARNLGYDEEMLSEYGAYDYTTLKALNPDINRNGIYDTEEGIVWRFQVAYNINLDVTNDDFDNDVIQTAPAEIFTWVSWIFGHDQTIPMYDLNQNFGEYNENIRLVFPPEAEIYDGSGDRIYDRAGVAMDINQLGFDMHPSGMTPHPPYDGDHEIHLNDDVYYLDNAQFLTAADGFEDFLLIIYKQELEPDGSVISMSWKWKLVQDGIYIDADPEAVRLRVKNLILDWDYPGGTYHPDYGDGTDYQEDVQEYWNNGTIIPPATVNAFGKVLGIMFEDTAGNSFHFIQPNGDLEE